MKEYKEKSDDEFKGMSRDENLRNQHKNFMETVERHRIALKRLIELCKERMMRASVEMT